MKKLLPYALSFCCGMPFLALGQPIRTILLPAPGSIRILNDSLHKNYTNITLEWQLLVNGVPGQKGSVPGLLLLPGHPRTIRLPLHLPTGGEEAFLQIGYRSPIRPRPLIASRQLKLKTWGGDANIPATGELSFTDSNDLFTITSQKLRLLFDKQTGWIQAYEVDHLLLVADSTGLRPAVNSTPHLQLFSTSTGSQMVIVRTEYTLPDIACLLHLSYTINAAGAMLVEQSVEADTNTSPNRAPLPLNRFGMDWMLPPGQDSLAWYGLTPGEDTSTIPAIHYRRASAGSEDSLALLPSSLMVRWWTITGRDGRGFRLTADSNFLYLSASPPADSAFRRLHPTGAQLHIDASLLRLLPGDKVRYAYKVTPGSFRK
jgi:beta-galactosidase